MKKLGSRILRIEVEEMGFFFDLVFRRIYLVLDDLMKVVTKVFKVVKVSVIFKVVRLFFLSKEIKEYFCLKFLEMIGFFCELGNIFVSNVLVIYMCICIILVIYFLGMCFFI